MLKRVIKAPINLYFDVTPIGRIMNKFSRDLSSIETQQSWMMGMTFANVFILIQVLSIAIYAVNFIVIILPFVVILSYIIVKKSSIGIRESVKLMSITKSPLLSYLGESIAGSSTIRAYKRQD
jgi:ABC-type multidrug transport system fused ATPase/permease subunit